MLFMYSLLRRLLLCEYCNVIFHSLHFSQELRASQTSVDRKRMSAIADATFAKQIFGGSVVSCRHIKLTAVIRPFYILFILAFRTYRGCFIPVQLFDHFWVQLHCKEPLHLNASFIARNEIFLSCQ